MIRPGAILACVVACGFVATTALAEPGKSPPAGIPHADLDKAGTKTIASGALKVTLSAVKTADGLKPRVIGMIDGAKAFEIDGEAAGDLVSAHARILRLDDTPQPQVLFSWFTGGAHCCAATRIATQVGGAWKIVETGDRDGDEAFTPIKDGDRFALAAIDNAFLYAFDSYADSYAPDQYYALRGEKLVDVTREPRFVPELRATLKSQERSANKDKSIWKTNGFLAGWVAQKALLGEQADAWKRMMASYDRTNPAGIPECDGDKPATECDNPAWLARQFPGALRAFLVENDYLAKNDPSTR